MAKSQVNRKKMAVITASVRVMILMIVPGAMQQIVD
jgi:hypothetical protein